MHDGKREKTDDVKTYHRFLIPFLVPIAVPGVVVTLFALWSYVTFGDIRSGWFRLGGYSLIAEQYQIDLGTVTAGESKPGTFRLRNLTGSPVVILGVQPDCRCLVAGELPVAIPSRKVLDFEVLFLADRVDSKTEVIRQMILKLSVDQPIQVLAVKVTIIPNKKEN
jgi:hypothetical protein